MEEKSEVKNVKYSFTTNFGFNENRNMRTKERARKRERSCLGRVVGILSIDKYNHMNVIMFRRHTHKLCV